MTPAPLTCMSMNYVESDIPEGQTLAEWRRELNAARRAAQPPRRRLRLSFRLWTPKWLA